MRRRWVVSGLAAAAALLLGADTVIWTLAQRQLRAGWEGWAAARKADGWTVTESAPESGGWPFAATLAIRGLSVAGGDADFPGGFSWRAERLTLGVDLPRPSLLTITPEGAQSLRLGRGPETPYTAREMRAEAPFGPAGISGTADLLVRDLRAEWPPEGVVSVGLLRATWVPGADPVFSVAAEAIGLPPRTRGVFGDHISSASLEGVLEKPPAVAGTLVARAQAWRDGGGRLRIQHFALGWGPLGASGAATIALDGQLQPEADGTVRLVGYGQALDQASAAGMVQPRAAVTAKAVLSLLARSAEDGGPAEVELPMRLHDRTVTAGAFPLAKLPALSWAAR